MPTNTSISRGFLLAAFNDRMVYKWIRVKIGYRLPHSMMIMVDHNFPSFKTHSCGAFHFQPHASIMYIHVSGYPILHPISYPTVLLYIQLVSNLFHDLPITFPSMFRCLFINKVTPPLAALDVLAAGLQQSLKELNMTSPTLTVSDIKVSQNKDLPK